MKPIRTAIVGYGVAGRVFHGPLLAADPRYSVDVIVTNNPERSARAHLDHPLATIVPSFADVIGRRHDLDLVIIASPPRAHASQALDALAGGMHVVVDKPFAATPLEAKALISRAASASLVLSVFQNRRWDADFLTLRRVLEEGALGEVHTFESRFEWWMPSGLTGWKNTTSAADGGGMLNDLGTHVIDQSLQLFGPAETVTAELTRRHDPAASDAEDDAFVSILHRNGVRSRLWMNCTSASPGPRFHVLGSHASYTKWGLDQQESSLAAGLDADDPTYGFEPRTAWGTISFGDEAHPVAPERGAYPEFYRLLALAVNEGAPVPVDAQDALQALRLIAAAREASATNRYISITNMKEEE